MIAVVKRFWSNETDLTSVLYLLLKFNVTEIIKCCFGSLELWLSVYPKKEQKNVFLLPFSHAQVCMDNNIP